MSKNDLLEGGKFLLINVLFLNVEIKKDSG